MTWTRNDLEQLRNRVQEVDDLWEKQQQQCFAEMTVNSQYSECHAREVAEGVTDEHFGWIPIASQQTQHDADERYDHHDRKYLVLVDL